MKKVIFLLILMIFLGLTMRLLYLGGYMYSGSRTALLFIQSERGKKARFSGCSGTIKRVVRFTESREYHFALATELEKGEIRVTLLDSKKKTVLCLDRHTSEGLLEAEAGKRYELVIHFESASGSYELDWS